MSRVNKALAKKARKKEKRRKWFNRLWIFTLFCIATMFVVVLAGVYFIDKRLETLPYVDAQYLTTYETSKIYDKHGKVIWEPTDRYIEPMQYDEIPDIYKDILIAVEDDGFWESYGFSPKGIANMVIGTIRSKFDPDFVARGGSTIDQQLIKNKYYDGGRGHEITTRKIQELFIARQLNENFTKEEILTFYVNDLEFAEGAIGTKAIMDIYFKKKPEDYEERTPENIAELAYLAGLSQAPTTYNLYNDEAKAHERMKVVLGVALEKEVISQKEYDEAITYDLTTNLQERGWKPAQSHKNNMKYIVYTDGVKQEIADMGYDIEEISLQIHTFYDPDVFESITEQVRQPKYYLDDQQQLAVTVIDSDGIVVGMVGSRSEGDWLNRAIQTTRSTASSTKPFLAYAPLLEYFGNQYNGASTFDTSNYPYPGSKAIMHNYGGAVHGHQTMQKSLRYSYNTPVGRIMDEILGSSRVKKFLHGVGLDVQETYSSVDGLGIHASTLDVAAAFNALNNLGEYTKPRFINEIEFSNGHKTTVEPTRHQAMKPSVAWVINHMLRGVPGGDGTASRASIPQYTGYAGKTGTNGFDKSVNPPAPYGIGSSDVWYNSITNGGYAISVWAGYDEPNTSPQIPSYYHQQQIVARDLQLMLNGNRNVANWKQPSGVKKLSGDGLHAMYAVTDSQDTPFHLPSWVALEDYDLLNIDDVQIVDPVDVDWAANESSLWFDYYQNGGHLNPDIVYPDDYKRMRGER